MADKWLAPWTQEQIKALEHRQAAKMLHPYTCGNDSSHALLVPTVNGWVCPDCDYKQNWAHDESWFLDGKNPMSWLDEL